jgi:hypothetical protein
MAVAGSVESPQFLLSGKPATAVICQTMAENEPSRNHMPGIHMNTPAGKGLRGCSGAFAQSLQGFDASDVIEGSDVIGGQRVVCSVLAWAGRECGFH